MRGGFVNLCDGLEQEFIRFEYNRHKHSHECNAIEIAEQFHGWSYGSSCLPMGAP